MEPYFTESMGVNALVKLVDCASKDTLVYYRDTCQENAKDYNINQNECIIWKDLGTFFSKQINRL